MQSTDGFRGLVWRHVRMHSLFISSVEKYPSEGLPLGLLSVTAAGSIEVGGTSEGGWKVSCGIHLGHVSVGLTGLKSVYACVRLLCNHLLWFRPRRPRSQDKRCCLNVYLSIELRLYPGVAICMCLCDLRDQGWALTWKYKASRCCRLHRVRRLTAVMVKFSTRCPWIPRRRRSGQPLGRGLRPR